MRWSASSSASTPTGQRGLRPDPASACRSPARSSRPTTAAQRREQAAAARRADRGRGRRPRHGAGARFLVSLPGCTWSGAVHASAVLVGERGVLMRGVSGTGKSLMALAIVERVRRGGGFAALVADDRVWLEVASDRLIARGAPNLAGCASAAARVSSRSARSARRPAPRRRFTRARRRAASHAGRVRSICNLKRNSSAAVSPGFIAGRRRGRIRGVIGVAAHRGRDVAKKRYTKSGFRLIIAPQRTKMRLLRRLWVVRSGDRETARSLFNFNRDSIKDSQLSYAGLRDPAGNTPGNQGRIWGGVIANSGNFQIAKGSGESGIYMGAGGRVHYRL